MLRGGDIDPIAYALMFSIVAGMMVCISITELIPAALRYDPGNQYAIRALILGMAVMAGSLLLFQAYEGDEGEL